MPIGPNEGQRARLASSPPQRRVNTATSVFVRQILRRRHERWALPKIRDVRLSIERHLAVRTGGDAGCRDLLLLDTAVKSFLHTARADAAFF